MIYLSRKSSYAFILVIIVTLLSGCQVFKKAETNPEEAVKQAIENMKELNSYEASAFVKIAPEEPQADGGHMKADIVYFRQPFSYSNLQELAMTSGDSDKALDKIILKNYVVDNKAYMFQSITNMWVSDDSKDNIAQMEKLANLFDSFEPEHFGELRIKEETKDTLVIAGVTSSSGFLYNLMQNFDKGVTGAFEMTIQKDQMYIQSLKYSPNIETEKGHVNHEILLEAKNFNKAPEIVVPEEAKQ